MNKFFKKALVMLLVLTLAFANVLTALADEPVTAAMPVSAEVTATAVSEDASFIPVRSFFAELGGTVDWDNDSRSITVTLEDDTYIFFADYNIAFKNDDMLILEVGVVIEEGRAYLSLADLFTLLMSQPGYLGTTISTTVMLAELLMEMLSVPGMTVAIVDAENDFTWTQGFGWAAEGVPVDEYTLFNLASISKSFTAVAVMQLVEAGLIGLDEPVVTYLPDFYLLSDLTEEGDYRNITPRMLLAHASGIHNDFMAAGVLTVNDYYPGYMDGFLELVGSYPMSSPEGTEYSYANNSYTLLGVLVASVMGYESCFEGFVEYTRENIFAPAGMELTTFALEARHLPYLAQPYADAATPAEAFLYYNALPAGGIYSNAHDMARFMHTVLNGGVYEGYRLLSEESLAQMFTRQAFETALGYMAPNMHPGLGFYYTEDMDGFVHPGHNGNLVHYHSSMVFDPASGLGVFVSVNSISGMNMTPEALADIILQTAIYEKTGVIPLPASDPTVEPVSLTVEELQKYEGLYMFLGADCISRISVLEEEGMLALEDMSGVPYPIFLLPLSDGSFLDLTTGQYLRFWFEELEGEVLLYLGEFKSMLAASKISEELLEVLILSAEYIEPLFGAYYAVTEEENWVSLISHAIVGLDENGVPYIKMFALHVLTPFSFLIPLGVFMDEADFAVICLGGIVFYSDGDDVWLEISGVRMIKD